MGDINIRTGMRLLASKDRAQEEIAHLSQERRILQEEALSLWKAHQALLQSASASNDQPLMHQVESERTQLLFMIVRWKKDTRQIVTDKTIESWGPSIEEELECRGITLDSSALPLPVSVSLEEEEDYVAERNAIEDAMNESMDDETELGYLDSVEIP
jgi:hypothetical protein